VFKILQYSVMECNSPRKITEGLFRDYMYSASCQYKYESPMTVSEILFTLSGL